MTALLTAQLKKLKEKAEATLEQVTSAAQLEQWRINYLGRKGALPQLLRRIKDLSLEERKITGEKGNKLRQKLGRLYQQKKKHFRPPSLKNISAADEGTTQLPIGHLHPITLAMCRLQDIMAALGFLIIQGPEVEQEYYDFDALNIPLEHPARAETDSFFLHPRRARGQGLVLRSSTSAVQVRAVIENNLKPPFRIASPGRVFRHEKSDPTHESTFHQIEALMVGAQVTVADFKGIMTTLLSTYFSQDIDIRLRPGYFPFVEPGFEVDINCVFCMQKGCRICQHTGWIEVMGAGMVHPNVLSNMNIDHTRYQGFAFGGAIDRLAMLRHSIDDIRLFWSGDLRFLKQFS